MASIQQQLPLLEIMGTTTETSITNMQQNVNTFVEQYNELSRKLKAAEDREKELQHVVDVLRKYIDNNDNLIRSFYDQHISTYVLDTIWDKNLE